MNLLVTQERVVEIDGNLVTEASDLGLAPGSFPLFLDTTMGNRNPFIRKTVGSDIVVYSQQSGSLELHILND